MSDITNSDPPNDITLWAATTPDINGDMKVSSPINIKGFWIASKSRVLDQDNNHVRTSVTVTDLDREIPTGSIMRLGRVADVPSPPTNLYSVADYNEAPDFHGENFVRSVKLIKYNNSSLPTIDS